MGTDIINRKVGPIQKGLNLDENGTISNNHEHNNMCSIGVSCQDGKKIKEDQWYTIENGKFIETNVE